jgi:hypothetical protein
MWFNGMKTENIELENEDRKHDIIFALAGLHHYTLEDLDRVLHHCKKTIKKGGYLILRDHDVTDDIDCCMVDNAHLIFNGLTGEPHMTEVNELRYLRSRKGWEDLLKKYGFDSIFDVTDGKIDQVVKISKIQKHDPTRNIMMCFKYGRCNNDLIGKSISIFSNVTYLFTVLFFPFIYVASLFFPKHPSNPTGSIDNVELCTTEDLKIAFIKSGGKVKQNFDSVAQIPEWFNVEYADKYPKFLIDYPWYLFPYLKANSQMIDICKFAYNVEQKNGTRFSSDIVMSLFVITCHCIGCILTATFGRLINSLMKAEDVGGVRHVLVHNPTNADLNVKTISDSGKYGSIKLKDIAEHNMCLVEVPMYRPFTEIVKIWMEKDENITIKLISGNDKVWVDVRGQLNGQTKWPVKTVVGLISDDPKDYVNYININVSEIRELFQFVQQSSTDTKTNTRILQIFQQ